MFYCSSILTLEADGRVVVKLGHALCYSRAVDVFSKLNAKQRPSLGSGEEYRDGWSQSEI